MRRKITTIYWMIAMAVLLAFGNEMTSKAEEQAVFRVQTAETLENGTIKVSVYLTDTTQLGGVDAELIYDPAKVSCVDSGLGASFKDGYGETHCDESKAVIKCVTIYPEAKTAQGELMYAVFKLNEGESYQPELKVVDLVDASKEIQSIPYSIIYQQADGEWAETQDVSGKKADDSIVKETKGEYETGTGQANAATETDKTEKAGEKNLEENNTEANSEDETVDNNKKTKAAKSKANKAEEVKKNTDKGKNAAVIIPALAIGGVIVLLVLIFVILRKRRGEGQDEA